MVDPLRLEILNHAPLAPGGRFVLYWMTAQRRLAFNPALERAAERARELGRPLLVLDALRFDAPWATERSHAFVRDGMADLAPRLARHGVAHYRYLEPAPGAGRGLLAALAADACLVVTDLSPAGFLPAARRAAASHLPVRLEAVDGVGLLPLAVPGRAYHRAFDFRRRLAAELPTHLDRTPLAHPLRAPLVRATLEELVRPAVAARWAPAPPDAPLPPGLDLRARALPERGGESAAQAALARFLPRAGRWAEDGRHPDRDATSHLSAFLHFGHLSPWAVVDALGHQACVDPTLGLQVFPEAYSRFLDELVTWRELAHNGAVHLPAYDRYEGLPPWSRATLEAHAADPRPHRYDAATLAAAATHDPLWNAAQRQLLHRGWMHNQLRMLWGKKVLEWSATPEEGFRTLLDLNNHYAVDGRDPNSVAGVAWVFGRYDRPWGPERPIFGLVRYMTSGSMRKKLEVDRTIAGAAP